MTLDPITRCCAAVGLSAREMSRMAWPLDVVLQQLTEDTLGCHGSLADALDVLDDAGLLETRLRAALICGPADVVARDHCRHVVYGAQFTGHNMILVMKTTRPFFVYDSVGLPSFPPHISRHKFSFRTGVAPGDGRWVTTCDTAGRFYVAPSHRAMSSGWQWRFP
jgi:hypothetical protein